MGYEYRFYFILFAGGEVRLGCLSSVFTQLAAMHLCFGSD